MAASQQRDPPVGGAGTPAPASRLRLSSPSFVGLLLTQLFGATNDNTLRWLVIGVGKQYVSEGQVGMVLSAGTAGFVLPYLLLAAPAGYLADRFSKRRVIVGCKVAEIGIMVLAIAAILSANIYFLFLVVAIMGAQSALFGPSKLGSIPEMLPVEKISAANGLMGLTTVAATVMGTALGNWLTEATRPIGQHNWWLSGLVLTSLAAVGLVTSLAICRLPAADPARRFPWDAHRQTYRDLAALFSNRALFRVALGITFFWSLGALANLNIDQFAFEGGAQAQTQITPLLVSLVAGVGLGSVLAGIWSGGRVELGILPLGAGGVAISAMLLFSVEGTLIEPTTVWTPSYMLACGLLGLLGLSAGLFDIPLEAYMQHRSPPRARGSILAATNFLTFAGMLLAAGLYAAVRVKLPSGEPLLKSREIFLLCGLFTIPVFIYIVWLIPQASIRFVVWLATRTVYRVRVWYPERLPEQGGALLVANHVSWADGVLMLVTSARPVRILISADWVQGPTARWLARTMGAIPIKPAPKSILTGIETARRALRRGELVCVFPEGGMTPTGQLQAFKLGVMEIVKGTSIPVVPVYLDELWGSIFSLRGGKVLWKWPRRWSYPVSIWIGNSIERPQSIQQIRQAVQDLGAEAVQKHTARTMHPPQSMLRRCKKSLFRLKISDSTGAELTGGSLLLRTLVLRRVLLREVFEQDEQYVGLLVPPSAAGAVVNAAVTFAGRVPVNLNFTASEETVNSCIDQTGIRHVLTSRKVMDKLQLDVKSNLVFLEDFLDKITVTDKVLAALQTYLVPAVLLDRLLGFHKIRSDDLLTIIFTSGSTGYPKGVMLTHQNIGTNVEAIDQVIHLRREDVLLGVLPLFHSFGFTVTVWAALALDVQCAYHFSPLDAREVGKLCKKRKVSVLVSTPTFLRSYLKRCSPEEFESLEVVVTGAEKLPVDLADAFEKRFGVRPIEGYGTTELSPLASVNVPPGRAVGSDMGRKAGSVGRPVPGVSAKVVDPDTFEDLPDGSAGMLLIKGPNVMKGYLGMPERTAEVIRDGWYVTGDIGRIDTDGYIEITGRQSRFSKIGGEMVPHIRVEEELQRLVAQDEGELKVVVTAVPDPRKGERLIVLYTELNMTPDEVCKKLAEAGLPNLWIPAADSFHQVESIPILGTGKLDLKRAEQLAKDVVGTSAPSS